MNPATPKQQQYLDHAFRYADKAAMCCANEQWSEAATNYGSALESLLRIRFGRGGRLSTLIGKFDTDPLFNSILMHDGTENVCATCVADEIRKLRNAVHPDCWKDATEEDVNQAALLVVMLYHAIVKCDGSRIAVFRIPPETALDMMESTRVHLERDIGEGTS